MEFQVDVLLRGEERATTTTIRAVASEPSGWTDADVTLVLKEMLRALDQHRNPAADPARSVYLRGISWIVEPDRDGAGVVIALEIPMGAAIAGPFAIEGRQLEAMIGRAIAAASGTIAARVVH